MRTGQSCAHGVGLSCFSASLVFPAISCLGAPPLGTPAEALPLHSARGEPPLDPAARFLRRLTAEENAWRDSEGWGYSRWRKGRSFSTLHRNGFPSRRASPPVESLGKVGGGGPGEEGGSPSSEGFPPSSSSSGTSRPPLSGCPALAPFGDDSPLLLAERQELVGQQRIGEGKVGTLMHTA